MRLILRKEEPQDYEIVEEVTREAFWNLHVPGCDEHYVAHQLRQADEFIPDLSYVAVVQEDGQEAQKIVGNIMYARACIVDENGIAHKVGTFGPVSVLPSYQKRAIGKHLILHTLSIARGMLSERYGSFSAILIYGYPDYYGKFGFKAAEDIGICGKDGYFIPALQYLELEEGALRAISGRFIEPSVYYIDHLAAAAYDLHFPPKQKGYKDSQARFQEMLSRAHK